MTKDEALRLALEALEKYEYAEARIALRTALEQPEPEPVAWMNKHGACMSSVFKKVDASADEYTTPLYTSPQRAEGEAPKQEPCPYVVSTREGTHHCSLSHREPLTDEQIKELLTTPMSVNGVSAFAFARAIEAAHGIKGGSMSITAMKQALEALENNVGEYRIEGAKALLHQAIAEAEKQCTHRLVDVTNLVVKSGYMCIDCGALFRAYTSTTPKREWKTLDPTEIDQGLIQSNNYGQTAGAWRDGVHWAQMRLKEKNND